MNNRTFRIDLKQLTMYLLKRSWIMVICGVIGFVGLYGYTAYYKTDTYSASATMYVLNGNPNLINYQYTNTSDLNSALQLLDTYMVVVRSKKVLNVVAERLSPQYPGITPEYIATTLSMGSVANTGVLQVFCTTYNPYLSRDICNAVLDVAPSEIIRVVSAGSIEIIDYAELPTMPDARSPKKKGMIGGLAGVVVSAAILVFLFLIDRKVGTVEELTSNYTLPILASIKRKKKKGAQARYFVLSAESSMETVEAYAKLRMNLFYTMTDAKKRVIEVTSSISGEGKSTVAANLAISCALSGKSVLLIDADMRRACQRELFGYPEDTPGLSDVLIQRDTWKNVVIHTETENLDVLPAGHIPPNPAELLSTDAMAQVLDEVEQAYDLVFLDVPPVNIVSDPLILAQLVNGCLFITRQGYSDHREIRKALMSAEMAGMNVMGFVFYGEKIDQSNYYGKKYYKNYNYVSDSQKQEKSPAKPKMPLFGREANAQRPAPGEEHGQAGPRQEADQTKAAPAAEETPREKKRTEEASERRRIEIQPERTQQEAAQEKPRAEQPPSPKSFWDSPDWYEDDSRSARKAAKAAFEQKKWAIEDDDGDEPDEKDRSKANDKTKHKKKK